MILVASQGLEYTPFSSSWIPESPNVACVGSTPDGQGLIDIYESHKGKLHSRKKSLKPKAFRCGKVGPASLNVRSLVTGNFGGSLEVWDVENLDSPLYHVNAHTGVMNSVSGNGGEMEAPEIVSGGREGHVKVWDTRQPDSPTAVFKPQSGSPDCWAVAVSSTRSSDRIVAAGFDNGDVKLFDLRNMTLLAEVNVGAGVCSLNFDDPLPTRLLVTGMDSQIRSYSLASFHEKKKNKDIPCSKASWSNSTVWVGEHLPQDRKIFVTTSGKGTLALWKYPGEAEKSEEMSEKLKKTYESGLSDQPITSLDWNKDKKGLAVCTSLNQTLQVVLCTKLE